MQNRRSTVLTLIVLLVGLVASLMQIGSIVLDRIEKGAARQSANVARPVAPAGKKSQTVRPRGVRGRSKTVYRKQQGRKVIPVRPTVEIHLQIIIEDKPR